MATKSKAANKATTTKSKTVKAKNAKKSPGTRTQAIKKSSAKKQPPAPTKNKIDNIAKIFAEAFTSRQTPPRKPLTNAVLEKRIIEYDVKFASGKKKLLTAINKINPEGHLQVRQLPEDVKKSLESIKMSAKRFHGAKLLLTWYPFPTVGTPCSDKFGYMSNALIRSSTRLPFNLTNQVLLGNLGDLMGGPARDTASDSVIPAGYTYFGQFVDHDVTLDISSTLDTFTDANTISNMRTPALDLDSLYGGGPGLHPFLYDFPTTGPATAIRFQLGTNTLNGAGGPGGPAGSAGMVQQTNFDLPRFHNPLNPPLSSNTAIIGDPRNDENLIVSQFHRAMLVFHNKVVDLLVVAGSTGDIFTEAKRIVTHHHQWAVVHDFLKRICGASAVISAMASVIAPVGSAFRMPVEFAVAAYRFGHSMIRNEYWLSFNFIGASLADVFQFIRNPDIPLKSDRVVDFNAFFDTGVFVPVNNKAKKIDSVLSNGLESIPGGSGIMAILATRNLRRGLALGLPSGQGMAHSFGFTPLTAAQLQSGLPPDEINVLNLNGGILLTKTPLWYYVLREAMVLQGGDQLGPVGAKIVADTFIHMLKRDGNSFLHVTGGFTPFLPSATAGDFTVADLIKFAGVNLP